MSLSYSTLIGAIYARAIESPDKVAIVEDGGRITYRELIDRSARVAANLRARGVRGGDRVMLAAVNSPDFVVSYLALHMLSAIVVPFRTTKDSQFKTKVAAAVRPSLVICSTLGHTRVDISYAELRQNAHSSSVFYIERSPDSRSVADIIFTSGSTGQPKGVVLTQENILTAASHIAIATGISSSDTELLSLPLSHSFGLGRLRCALLAGATLTFVEGLQSPGLFFGALGTYGITGFASVPAGISALLRFGERGLGRFRHQLRFVEIGSAPMTEVEKQKLMQTLPNTRLMAHYGMTEASRSTFLDLHLHKGRLSSIGRSAPGVSIEVRDRDGHTRSPGDVGELWISGHHLAAGYWQDDALTAARFQEGWLRSGDTGYMDEDGFFYLTGRLDDMINSAGFSFHPSEVENVLLNHPAISEAVCVGIDDPQGIVGQIPVVALVAAAGHAALSEHELTQFCSDRLESHKRPRSFCWFGALPKSETGKPLRGEIRRQAGLWPPVRDDAR